MGNPSPKAATAMFVSFSVVRIRNFSKMSDVMNSLDFWRELSEELREKSRRVVRSLFVMLVGFYQVHLSVWLGGNCRFYPSCSNYALEALTRLCLWRSIKLIFRRLLRCHPCGGCGFDPVPTDERIE